MAQALATRSAWGARRGTAGASRRRRRRVAVSGAASGGADDVEEAAKRAFLVARFAPWVKDDDGAARCLAYIRTEEKREFDLSKAEHVLTTLREAHELSYPFVPWELPKTWPGMQHVLRRCSTPLE